MISQMQAKLQVLSYNLKQAYTVRVDLEKEGSLYKLNNKVDTQRGIVTFSKVHSQFGASVFTCSDMYKQLKKMVQARTLEPDLKNNKTPCSSLSQVFNSGQNRKNAKDTLRLDLYFYTAGKL